MILISGRFFLLLLFVLPFSTSSASPAQQPNRLLRKVDQKLTGTDPLFQNHHPHHHGHHKKSLKPLEENRNNKNNNNNDRSLRVLGTIHDSDISHEELEGQTTTTTTLATIADEEFGRQAQQQQQQKEFEEELNEFFLQRLLVTDSYSGSYSGSYPDGSPSVDGDTAPTDDASGGDTTGNDDMTLPAATDSPVSSPIEVDDVTTTPMPTIGLVIPATTSPVAPVSTTTEAPDVTSPTPSLIPSGFTQVLSSGWTYDLVEGDSSSLGHCYAVAREAYSTYYYNGCIKVGLVYTYYKAGTDFSNLLAPNYGVVKIEAWHSCDNPIEDTPNPSCSISLNNNDSDNGDDQEEQEQEGMSSSSSLCECQYDTQTDQVLFDVDSCPIMDGFLESGSHTVEWFYDGKPLSTYDTQFFPLTFDQERCGDIDVVVVVPPSTGTGTASPTTTAPTTSFSEGPTDGGTTTTTTTTDTTTPTTPTTTTKQPAWPFMESDIPLDPKVSYGELENGLRWMFMPNNEPPGQIQLRLHVDIGANGETEEQRGLAHFLEHMAFRTTKTFPEGTDLDRQFGALGIDFGRHINAYTNFEETLYYLGMLSPEESTIDLAFSWMRDIVDGMELIQEELDTERGVVISEHESRDSVSARQWRRLSEWMMPEHLMAQRHVIGLVEAIEGFTREMFVDFYGQYYVPRRTTFSVVGNMTVEQVEELMEEYFGSVVDTGNRGREPDYGTVTPGRGLETKIFLDNEQLNDILFIDGMRNYQSVPDTIANRVYNHQINLANSIVTSRIQELTFEEGANITWGSANRGIYYQTVVEPYIEVYVKEGFWREAVSLVENELRKAILYGFTQAEFDEVVANSLNDYEQSVASQDGFKSDSLADLLSNSVNGRYVVSSPEEDLRIFNIARELMTTDTLHEAFSAYWNTTDLFLYLYAGSLDVSEEQAAEELKDLWLASQEVELEPPVEAENITWAYTDFGAPGTVVSDTMVEDLEIRQIILSNGIRVNLKKTDFQEDLIHMVARFGTGVVGQPKDRTFLDEFTDYMVTWGGLGEHNWRDLDRVLAGRTAGVSMGVSEGAFTLSGTTNQDDLELQLQLMASYLTDPAYGEEAVQWWMDEAYTWLDYFDQTLDGPYYYEALAWLKGGDKRFTAPSEEEIYAFQASDAEEWLSPQANSSYLEISIVGDLEDQETIDYLLKTFGALPQRDDAPPQFTEEEQTVNMPQAPQSITFTYESKIPKAAQMVVWETLGLTGEDTALHRQLYVLSEILSFKLFEYIRKELGATYSPSAWSTESSAFDYGYIMTYVEGIPEELELFDEAIMLIADNMTKNGITQDDLEVSRAPIETRVEEDLRSNSYWLYTVLEESQAKPFHLDWARNRAEAYSSVTVEDINALAQEYLTADRALHMSIVAVNGTETAAAQ